MSPIEHGSRQLQTPPTLFDSLNLAPIEHGTPEVTTARSVRERGAPAHCVRCRPLCSPAHAATCATLREVCTTSPIPVALPPNERPLSAPPHPDCSARGALAARNHFGGEHATAMSVFVRPNLAHACRPDQETPEVTTAMSVRERGAAAHCGGEHRRCGDVHRPPLGGAPRPRRPAAP